MYVTASVVTKTISSYPITDTVFLSHGLYSEGVSCRINPSAVLNFLWACLHKPVLWQGCVKREAIENSNISMVSACAHIHTFV